MRIPERLDAELVRLRRHQEGDVEAFVALATNPDVTRHLALSREQKTRDGAEKLMAHVISTYDSDEPVFSLTIADPETDRFVGSCGGHPERGEFEIYYVVDPAYQGRGLATDAVRAIIDYIFRSTEVPRIAAYVCAGNLESVRVVEKLGFVDSGEVRRPDGAEGAGTGKPEGRRYVLERWPLP